MSPFYFIPFAALIAIAFYWYGHISDKKYIYDNGYKDGYAKGREDVNAHLDTYRKNGGWSV
ncbi:MAG: hypothetical protein R3328_00220 [Planococcaceae bacterium]|nr:hypothetical protein [Planococcaceae bacterium]